MAIATFVGLCNTLRTVPYAPLPSSSSSCNCDILIENDAPLVKLTPCACKIALPPKWSAPDASLHRSKHDGELPRESDQRLTQSC